MLASAQACAPDDNLDHTRDQHMANSALTELQQQIEAIRREAFQAGYAAAMQAVRELASRSAPQSDAGAAAPSRGRIGRSRAAPRQGSRPAASRTRSRRRRPERGANARMIEEILAAAAPRALAPAAIRKALQEKGVHLAFTSIRHALGQLKAQGSEAGRQQQNMASFRQRLKPPPKRQFKGNGPFQ